MHSIEASDPYLSLEWNNGEVYRSVSRHRLSANNSGHSMKNCSTIVSLLQPMPLGSAKRMGLGPTWATTMHATTTQSSTLPPTSWVYVVREKNTKCIVNGDEQAKQDTGTLRVKWLRNASDFFPLLHFCQNGFAMWVNVSFGLCVERWFGTWRCNGHLLHRLRGVPRFLLRGPVALHLFPHPALSPQHPPLQPHHHVHSRGPLLDHHDVRLSHGFQRSWGKNDGYAMRGVKINAATHKKIDLHMYFSILLRLDPAG